MTLQPWAAASTSARCMAQHGTPRSLADLAQHALIGFDTETPFIRSIGKSLQSVFNRDNFALRSDSDLAHWALIQAGAGIGLSQVAQARAGAATARASQSAAGHLDHHAREPALQPALPRHF